ncbi:MAG: secondary thiamine-phosphate synthase enzyme YjbQ [Candidatus Hodarchaeales archaeon]
MTVYQTEIKLKRTYETDIIDITHELERVIKESKIVNGILNVFNAGSTGSIITLEFEPGLLRDIPDFLEQVIPKSKNYYHEQTWHDGNGHSHVRASLLGPSLTLPVKNGELIHGTWQQVAFIELDIKPRSRRLHVTIIGE